MGMTQKITSNRSIEAYGKTGNRLVPEASKHQWVSTMLETSSIACLLAVMGVFGQFGIAYASPVDYPAHATIVVAQSDTGDSEAQSGGKETAAEEEPDC